MNLLLVHHDADRAAPLRAELGAIGHRVEVAAGADDALIAIERTEVDAAVIVDGSRRTGGVTIVRQLREHGKTLPVVMLSTTRGAIEALDAGADDHVVASTSVAELDARLRAILRGRDWSTAARDTIRAGGIVVDPTRFRARRSGRTLELTRLEFALLAELARHAGGFLTRAVLIERVWGYDVEPAANIVDAQIRSLRRKLAIDGEDDPIVTKRGVGYMLRG